MSPVGRLEASLASTAWAPRASSQLWQLSNSRYCQMSPRGKSVLGWLRFTADGFHSGQACLAQPQGPSVSVSVASEASLAPKSEHLSWPRVSCAVCSWLLCAYHPKGQCQELSSSASLMTWGRVCKWEDRKRERQPFCPLCFFFMGLDRTYSGQATARVASRSSIHVLSSPHLGRVRYNQRHFFPLYCFFSMLQSCLGWIRLAWVCSEVVWSASGALI